MRLQRQSNRQTITLNTSPPLGKGGEAEIYPVVGDTALAAKIYHKPTPAHRDKLQVMLAHPPMDPMRSRHTSIAWPVDLLHNTVNGQFSGFLMPCISDTKPIHHAYNPSLRLKQWPGFNYRYLHNVAANLTQAVAALHQSGYVIGDINESNILVSATTLVTLVDTDSFQVRDPRTRTVYRCPVGKPEYTPPEMQAPDFKTVDRCEEHDLFGLAVIVFQLLMEGTHPFDGVYQVEGDPPELEKQIAVGHFPHGTRKTPYRPKPLAPSFGNLHPELQRLFDSCFVTGHLAPHYRPSAEDWYNTLQRAVAELVECRENQQHRYGGHLRTCPWCERAQRLGTDPFPGKPASSTPYQPPVKAVQSVTGISNTRPTNPKLGDIWVNPKDSAEMVFIPEGPFQMGDSDRPDNPRHTVTLSGYWIYKNVVTVNQYLKFCADTGYVKPPAPNFNAAWRKEDHPIVNVSWEDAKAYCDWAGVRLPTEAEWEKAARGTDGRRYPWGDGWDASKAWCSKSKYGDTGGTTAMGKYGISPYGLSDMAGNVWQWCSDWYDADYCKSGHGANPTGPTSGQSRVRRGGSWDYSDPDYLRSANRSRFAPGNRFDDNGFRGASGP